MCWKGKKVVICVKKEKEEEEEEQWMPELPDEVWVEIMRKLPIKPLHICKCVSKTWLSYVSHILYSFNKGLDLPPLGILFRRTLCLSIDLVFPELCYLSLDNYNLTHWSCTGHESEPKSAIVQITHTQTRSDHSKGIGSELLLLSSLSIDFGSLNIDLELSGLWTMHRGLALVTSMDNHSLFVYNPATREKFVLPTSPYSLGQTIEGVRSMQSTIINLSDCLLSTQCNFKVIRFSKRTEKDSENGAVTTRAFAEVYYSNNNQWCHSEIICPNNSVLADIWLLNSAVLLDDTLIFHTCKRRRAVGVKFLWGDGEGKGVQVSAFYLPLPKYTRKPDAISTFHVSQGCLYLSYFNFGELCIWKHDNKKSFGAQLQIWIPEIIFTKSPRMPRLSKPVAKTYLRRIFGVKHNYTAVIAFHPDAPVVFIHIQPFVYAFNLLNDTVEKIAELRQKTCISVGYAKMYSPCFASFQCLKHQNHQPT